MKQANPLLIVLIILFIVPNSRAQDSLLLQLASENMQMISYSRNSFNGPGWEFLKNKVRVSNNVLIGEDHFSNEIPSFIQALAGTTSFDNFYIEVDPYTAEIIEKSLKEYSEEERKAFNEKYGHLFSFYSLKPEYELLQQMVEDSVNILGSDQVIMYDDRLIFQDLSKNTENEEAIRIYTQIIEQSQLHLDAFFQDPQNPMYFMTPDFSLQLEHLKALKLGERESKIIADMEKSVSIYLERSHEKRVQLIKHHLMEDYPIWRNGKNLFKYGANHMARGESFLSVMDIGNLVANITEAQYQQSLHIMIVGASGMLGTPFESFPPNRVDPDGFYLKPLKPFFQLIERKHWYLFDLLPLREALDENSLEITEENLCRVIKGFDILVIIPEVTAAKF